MIHRCCHCLRELFMICCWSGSGIFFLLECCEKLTEIFKINRLKDFMFMSIRLCICGLCLTSEQIGIRTKRKTKVSDWSV